MSAARLRVAHVVLQLRTGGMEKFLAELARHADRARHDLHFVCLGESGPVADEIVAHGWPVTVLDKPRGFRPRYVFKLAKLFSRLGTEVIHTHNNAPLLYSGAAARMAMVPVLLQTRHGQAIGTSRKHRAAVRFASMLARRVVCVSEDSRQVAEREGIPPRKLMTILNGIDSRRFDYTGPKSGGPAVMVARMVAAKGADVLLRAVQQVLSVRPDFRLVMAGDGVALPSLIGLARDFNVEHSVQFLGEVRDIPALLATASQFILPSLSEGVSLTVLEAMARGLPVVTTRVGGSPEVVEDPTTGLLVPPSNPDELAAAILKVWTNPELGERMGRAGRLRVEQTFEVRHMTRQYEDLYRRLSSEAKYGARRRCEPARLGV